MLGKKALFKMLEEVAARCPASLEDALLFHDEMEEALQRAGFEVRREVLAPYPGNLKDQIRRGRIDLVAIKPGEVTALELDKVSPRRKSVIKLREFLKGSDAVEARAFVVMREGREGRPRIVEVTL